MQKICYIVGLLLLLTTACEQKQTQLGEKPDKLVPVDKMAQILTQVHLNEVRVSKYGIGSSDSSSMLYNRLHMQTLKKFGVDTASYTQSYIYYSARPEELAQIYERVVDTLKQQQKAREKAATKKPA